jgi:hypothetical protein
MIKVIHSQSKKEFEFHDKCDPRWAVAYADETGRLSWLFSMAQAGLDEEAYRILGVAEGSRPVTCGDWAVSLAETNPVT